ERISGTPCSAEGQDPGRAVGGVRRE
ncbi:MAG: hypothetical protein AVDCRST_MAG85-3934, partial [uncultured Solirubrobacteraceae bacterium]